MNQSLSDVSPVLPRRTSRWRVYRGADQYERLLGWFLSLPATGLMLLFLIGPIAAVLLLSFTDWQLGMSAFEWIGLDNYAELFSDPTFWQSLKNTMIYVAIVVPGSVFLGLGAAMLIEAGKQGKSFYRAVYFLPVMATLIAMSIVWQVILHPDFGLLNLILKELGIAGPNWLQDSDLVLYVLCGIGIWQQVGFNLVLFISGLMSIPSHLYEAAEMDGASSAWDRFRLVTWPLLGPITLFVVVITSSKAFQVFDTVQVLTKGGPNKASEVLLYTIYTEAFEYFRTSYAAAITVVFLFFVLLLTLLKTRFLERKVHYS
ncbi:sugar ABC transporter permease [Amphritea opalescens]|uniref:Sugar ABC transporter permease n=1 Tax=Amphritea opalescens TaxID=2490544 RepID=A0A430KPS0_9GAMM|nr:sugar ABC transporter permease [Amphritea opalescens]RTE65343.1 sugar ABC transporter permease [Amphritea opalescens]